MPAPKAGAVPPDNAHEYASDSDEDMLAGPSPGAATGAKRGPGRPKSSTTAAKPRQKRARTVSKKDTAPKVSEKRGAKTDLIQETQAPDDLGDVDDLDDAFATAAPLETSEAPSKKSRTQTNPAKGRGRAAASDAAGQDTEGEAQASSSLSRTAKKAPRPAKRDTVPETQPDPMDVEPEPTERTQDDTPDDESQATNNRKTTKATKQAASKKRSDETVGKDAKDSGELQQRLGEMTAKFNALQAQYKDLKEVGIEEAEENYETLKQRMEERNKITDKLIAKLKGDAAAAAAKTTEISGLQSEIQSLRAEKEAATVEKAKMQTFLEAAQAENKTLQAKLAATRSASESSKPVPGSAVKGPAARQAATAEAQKDIAKRKLKEELYGDLTDLIIRDVKRRDETGEDVFDCFQTGRNGTLQFHLSIPNPPPPDEAFADVEIGYEPMLDESRDRQIIDVLPEFAREEICFQRGQAAKFYAQIREAIQKRVVDAVGTDAAMQNGV